MWGYAWTEGSNAEEVQRGALAEGRWAPERLLADLERLALRAPTRAEFFDEAAARLRRTVRVRRRVLAHARPRIGPDHPASPPGPPRPLPGAREQRVRGRGREQVRPARARRAQGRDAAARRPAAIPERSARFRDLLTPAGLGPELRSAFVADGATWGALILVRRAGAARIRGPRRRAARRRLGAVRARRASRTGRRGLRIRRGAPRRSGGHRARRRGGLIRASSSAEPLLAELSGGTVEAGVRSPSIHAIATATRTAIAAAGRARDAAELGASRRRPGRWLVLHGGLLGAPRSGEVAVFIQRAHPTLVAPLLLRAYGLTPREQEVTQLMLRGRPRSRPRSGWRSRRTPSATTSSRSSRRPAPAPAASSRATLFFGEHLPRIQDRVRSATTPPSSTPRARAA